MSPTATSKSKIPRPISRANSGIPVRAPSKARTSIVVKNRCANSNVIKPIITKKAITKKVPFKKEVTIVNTKITNKTVMKRKSFGQSKALVNINSLKQTTIPDTYMKSAPLLKEDVTEEMKRKEKENSLPLRIPSITLTSPTMSIEQFNIKLSSEFDNSEFYMNQILANKEITFTEAQKLSPIFKAYKFTRPADSSAVKQLPPRKISMSEKKPFLRSTMTFDVKNHRPKLLSAGDLSPSLVRRVTWSAASPKRCSIDPFEEAMTRIRRLTLMKQNTPSRPKTPESSYKKLDAFEEAMQRISAMKARKNLNFVSFPNVSMKACESEPTDNTLHSYELKVMETTPVKKIYPHEAEMSGTRKTSFLQMANSPSVCKNEKTEKSPNFTAGPKSPLQKLNMNSLGNLVNERGYSVYRPLKSFFENSALKKIARLTDISEKSEGDGTRPSTPICDLITSPTMNDVRVKSGGQSSPFPSNVTSIRSSPGIRFTPYKMDLRGDVHTVQTVTPSSNVSTPSMNSILLSDSGNTKAVFSSHTPICTPLLFPVFSPNVANIKGLVSPLKTKLHDLSGESPPHCGFCITKRTNLDLADQECAKIMLNQWSTVRKCRNYLRNPVAFILTEMEIANFIPIEDSL